MAAPIDSFVSAALLPAPAAESSKALFLSELDSNSLIARIQNVQSQLKKEFDPSPSVRPCEECFKKSIACLKWRQYTIVNLQNFSNEIGEIEKQYAAGSQKKDREREAFILKFSEKVQHFFSQMLNAPTLDDENSDLVYIRKTYLGIEGVLCQTKNGEKAFLHPHGSILFEEERKEKAVPESWPAAAKTLEDYTKRLIAIRSEQSVVPDSETLSYHTISELISDPYADLESEILIGNSPIKVQIVQDLPRLKLTVDGETIRDGSDDVARLYEKMMRKFQMGLKLGDIADEPGSPNWETVKLIVENALKMVTQGAMRHLTEKIFHKYDNSSLEVSCKKKQYSVDIKFLGLDKSKLEFVHHVYFIIMDAHSHPEKDLAFVEGYRRVVISKENLAIGCTDSSINDTVHIEENIILHEKDPIPPVVIPVAVVPAPKSAVSVPRVLAIRTALAPLRIETSYSPKPEPSPSFKPLQSPSLKPEPSPSSKQPQGSPKPPLSHSPSFERLQKQRIQKFDAATVKKWWLENIAHKQESHG